MHKSEVFPRRKSGDMVFFNGRTFCAQNQHKMAHGDISLRLMAHGLFKVHQIPDTSPLTYLAYIATLVQIADDQPDAALRDSNFPRNLPGGDPRMFGQQRQNRRVVCDKGPPLFELTVTTDFWGSTLLMGQAIF
jgi:hypothetical protein